MFSWAIVFLVIAFVSAVFGFITIAATASEIAWLLLVAGLLFSLVAFVRPKRTAGG